MTKQTKGFTVIELIFIILVIGAASVIFFIQKNNIETVAKDDAKKTAINAMYYALEEVYYKENNYYPQEINSEILRSVDPDLFTDPFGIKLGDSGSIYSYSPKNCESGKCKEYELKAVLVEEEDYKKVNRN